MRFTTGHKTLGNRKPKALETYCAAPSLKPDDPPNKPAPRPLAASQPVRLPPLGFPEEDVGFGTPVPVADVCLATPVPVAQPLADGAPPAPSSPAHSAGRPDGGARFEADSDTAPPAGLPRMPDLDSPPIRSALARLDQVDLQVLLQQRCLFFQCPPKFPPLAPTASQNRSGARGFWTSKPAGGSCSFRVPPVASQPLRVTPNRRFRLPSKTAARSVQPGWSARESSPQPAQPSSPAPWPLCRSTPLPSCATQQGDPPSRTSPWTRRFWNSSLRPLSRSPPTRSLQICAVPVKEQQRAPVATPRRRSIWSCFRPSSH